ncbi:TonB-dependent receptor [Novosphingobium sp. 1949]|uniref:TonB-dependent receptor n=1 Tax=Novosphingobium organovorum TaxID=2930092 RepID=A0ABT0B8V7_9SPHN|nr:TonB-dependent receptor [Novosphingobium organovorum]MCJ2181496.1 TonB-dependent receptor [Novosphingobium organovorum]
MSLLRARPASMMLGCSLLSIVLAHPALARDAAAGGVADTAAFDDADAAARRDSSDTITVNGERQDAIASAQSDAINASSLTTIVSGEELRAQPQQNLADLLAKLPGLNSSVDMSRQAGATGEAQYLSIRGFDNSYNAYELNGVRMAQTDASTRAISMNLLSPFAVSQVRIDKAPNAAQDGDAIAGIVDLRMMSAFDAPENYVQIRAQGQLAGRAVKQDQAPFGGDVQIETAQRSGDFGVFASAYYGKKSVFAESTAIHKDYVLSNENTEGDVRDNLDAITGRGVEWVAYRSKIERWGGALNFDWNLDESTHLYWQNTYGEYRLKSYSDQMAVRQINDVSYDDNGDLEIYGPGASYYARTEHSVQTLFSSKLGGETKAGDVTMTYHAAYSKGTQTYPLRLQAKWQTDAYDTDDTRLITTQTNSKAPQVVLSDDALSYFSDAANYNQKYITAQWSKTWESRWEGQFDADWQVNDALSVSAGAKAESSVHFHNDLSSDSALEYDFADGEGTTLDQVPGTWLSSILGGANQIPVFLINENYLENLAKTYSLSLSDSVDADYLTEDRLRAVERRFSGYVMANLELGEVKVTPGLRLEHNQFAGYYYSYVEDADGNSALEADSSSRSYDMLLPSVIATWRPNADSVYRFSVRKSYTRPALDLLLGATQRSYDEDGNLAYVFQPNPDAKATTSWNVDASAEFKGSGADMFSVAVYYKDLTHVMFSTGTTDASGDWNVWSTDSTSSEGVEVSTVDTSATGHAVGIELAGRYALKGLEGSVADGLGINGNVTLQRTHATVTVAGEQRDRSLPQAPDLMFNLGLFYLHGPVSANLDYSYQGKKLYDLRSTQPDTYIQPVGNANFAASYAVTDRLTVGGSISNLFNAHTYWATAGSGTGLLSVDRKGGYLEVGRTYMLNASMRM